MLAAQLIGGVGSELGVLVVGSSAESWFLAYLHLCRSGSLAASFAVVLIAVHQQGLVQGQRSLPSC